MKIQMVVQVWLLTLLVGIGSSAVHVRYNAAGYFPNGDKRFVVMADENMSGKKWDLSKDGASAASGVFAKKSSGATKHSPSPYNYVVSFASVTAEGEYTLSVDGAEPVKVKIAAQPYVDVMSSNLRWLRVQRSGSDETLDHEPSHLGDTAVFVYRKEGKAGKWSDWVEDPNGLALDMKGGWYAAGNYGKFTSAIGYTTYYLLKAYDLNPSLFTKKYSQSNLVDILDEAKFGLEYLLKVMPNDKEFIIQVGGFDSEHGIRLPKDDAYEGKRACYSAFSDPQMGFTVAALAMGAQVFAEKDADFAAKCKAEALKIYAKTQSVDCKPVWLEKDYDLFKDDSRFDNMLLAAAEMYKLTGDAQYLEQAKKYSGKAKNAWWAGWNVQNMMGHSLIMKESSPAVKYMEKDLSSFFETHKSAGNIWGVPMEAGFSGFYAANIIGVAAVRFEMIQESDTYRSMVMDILNYGYGVNNWGVSFTASPSLPNSVKNFNLPIYKLQTHLFPEGAIALGPCDTESHDGESKWILDDIRANYCYPFNTKAIKFFDHADDYMTTDSWIFAIADNIYLLTLATTLLSK